MSHGCEFTFDVANACIRLRGLGPCDAAHARSGGAPVWPDVERFVEAVLAGVERSGFWRGRLGDEDPRDVGDVRGGVWLKALGPCDDVVSPGGGAGPALAGSGAGGGVAFHAGVDAGHGGAGGSGGSVPVVLSGVPADSNGGAVGDDGGVVPKRGGVGAGSVAGGRGATFAGAVGRTPNQRKRDARKRRKVRKQQGKVAAEQASPVVDEELRDTSRDKWIAQNKLAAARARQALKLVEMRDVEQQARAERARAVMLTEKRLVAVEKAHGELRKAGEVPAAGAGFAETVASLSTGSISPNSSISMAEVHKLHADKETALARVKELERAMLRLGLDVKELGKKKDLWTVGENGEPVEDEILADIYGSDYATYEVERPDGTVAVRVA